MATLMVNIKSQVFNADGTTTEQTIDYPGKRLVMTNNPAQPIMLVDETVPVRQDPRCGNRGCRRRETRRMSVLHGDDKKVVTHWCDVHFVGARAKVLAHAARHPGTIAYSFEEAGS